MAPNNNAKIDTFNQHGEDFWDLEGPYKTLHHINSARMSFIEKNIDWQNQSILDIGCGGGVLSEAMAKKGAKVEGIDLSEVMVTAAKQHVAQENLLIRYRQISSGQCVADKEQYTAITCMEMLEHVQNPAIILNDIYELLLPGGYVFLSTLNRNIYSYLLGIIAAEKIMHIVPKGTHDWQYFIQPKELINMVNHAGLQTVALSGLDYNPCLKKARLSNNIKVNYLLAARKPA